MVCITYLPYSNNSDFEKEVKRIKEINRESLDNFCFYDLLYFTKHAIKGHFLMSLFLKRLMTWSLKMMKKFLKNASIFV